MASLTRRSFIKVSAIGTASAVLAGCGSEHERWVELEPYVRPPEEQIAGVANWYATTCRACPAGCGVIARVMNGRALKLEGNPEHPVNRGKLCARGQSALQVLYNPDRTTTAARQSERGSRKYEPVAWNEGINTLHERLQAAGNRVAVWTGSTTPGHLYDLFSLFTGAVGAPAPLRFDLYTGFNGYAVLQDTSETLLGRAALPAYDVGNADVVLSFGADFLGSWVSSVGYSVEYGEFRDHLVGRRGYFIQIEPRMSNTAAVADRWIPARPGTEVLVARALARIIADQGLGAEDRVERASALAGEIDLDSVAEQSGIAVGTLEEIARLFAGAERPLAIPGGALAGRDNAAAAVAAVQALNVIGGNIGGTGGMSLTPEAPELAAPPVSTYADALALVQRMNNGEVDVLLVHGANPVFELPASAGLADALQKVPYIVSFSSIVDETAVWADLLLPDRTALESWGYSVVTPSFNGLPAISSQQPVVSPLFDIYSTADVLLTVAKGLPAAAGALPWPDEVAFIRERVAGLPAGAAGGDDNDVRWARFLQQGGWWPAETPAAEASEVNISGPVAVEAAQFQGEEGEYPYYLYLFLSPLLGDGSGASQPWLQGTPDPMTTITWQTWIEINPKTAEDLNLDNGDVVRVTSPYGEIEALVYKYPAIRPDTVAIPIGQGHSALGRYARERGSNPVNLIGAQEDAAALPWSALRVKLERTDDHKALAVFESTIETDEIHVPHSLGDRVGA